MKKTWLDTQGREIIEELQTEVDELVLEMSHDSELFPEDTDRKAEFTAGNLANTWSAWVEIQDDTAPTPITLSSRITQLTHISGFLIEDLSHKDKRYEFQIAHGDAKVRITSHRFLTGDIVKKLAAIQFIRVRSEAIPAGEKVYYRMKCEQADATCEVSIRYHYHP
ncbi:hypothetical protein ES703_61823 [subsurface metagenome]